MKAGALDGVRVLDFTAMMAGPYATRLMADLGAQVTKVEPPEGDHIRVRPPLRDGCSAYFGGLNCGKRGLCVDLRKPAGRELVLDLARRADVVVENFRPGVMRRMGFGYDTLVAQNRRLVYCSISGYGQSGPYAARAAYAPIVHAASGFDMANFSYQEGLDRPLRTGLFIADVLAGALAFGAVNAALLRRAAGGQGEYIDLSLMDTMFGLMPFEVMDAQFESHRRRPLYRPVKAADGFLIVAPISQNNFEAMARAAGHAEWIRDERFATPAAREHHWDELMDLLDAWAASRTARECERIMSEGGVPCARYVTVREAMASEYARERGSFVPVRDAAGEFLAANAPFALREGAVGARPRVPALGEHNRQIAQELGRSPAEINRLCADNVLCQGR